MSRKVSGTERHPQEMEGGDEGLVRVRVTREGTEAGQTSVCTGRVTQQLLHVHCGTVRVPWRCWPGGLGQPTYSWTKSFFLGTHAE